jgi:hypothetical protein
MEEITVEMGMPSRRFGRPGVEAEAEAASRTLRFHVYRKPVRLGDLEVDHWWMDIGTLYGQRNRRASNQAAVVDYWWALCTQDATVLDEPTRESYILARLLPFARSNGSRRVFVDSVPTRPGGRRELTESVTELEQRLADSADGEMDKAEFHSRTGDLLGPPEYPREVHDRYHQLSEELLCEAREALEQGGHAGLDMALARWTSWMNSIGRRRGNELEKQVLDALSYECRTAFHCCYSAVWCDLIPHLQRNYNLSTESAAFLAFWHLEPREESNQPELAYFHLFHGHIFALHPACGAFMLTQTGSRLLSEWLPHGGRGASYRRLLHGLFVAVYQYAQRHQVCSLLRRGEGRVTSVSDMVALEEQLVEEGQGRRRPRRRRTDAR